MEKKSTDDSRYGYCRHTYYVSCGILYFVLEMLKQLK